MKLRPRGHQGPDGQTASSKSELGKLEEQRASVVPAGRPAGVVGEGSRKVDTAGPRGKS